MGSKNPVATMIQGLGLGMRFLTLLLEKIIEKGGYEEMLHFLTTDRGGDTLDKIAQLVVDSPWKIPRSLMEKLAAQESIMQNGCGDYTGYDSKYYWEPVLDHFGLEALCFNDHEGTKNPIPDSIKQQLVGSNLSYPLLVNWDGEPQVVVQIVDGPDLPEDKIGQLLVVNIVPAKYFDLER